MARNERGDDSEGRMSSGRKQRASRKVKKNGVMVGIAAVVLVGVAGKVLSRFVRLNKTAASADVLSKTLVSGEAAENLQKPPDESATAALGSAFQKMNGERITVVNGRVLEHEQVEDSHTVQLDEVRGFVVSGAVQRKAGTPTISAEIKLVGEEGAQDQALHHEIDLLEGDSRSEAVNAPQESIESGTSVVSCEPTVGTADVEQQLYVSEDADVLPSLEFVTSVSYAENSMQMKCTTTNLKPPEHIEERSSASLLKNESCSSQEAEEPEISEVVVTECSPEPSAEYAASTSLLTSPWPVEGSKLPRSPPGLGNERVVDRTVDAYEVVDRTGEAHDFDLLQNHLVHSKMGSVTTCVDDGPPMQERAVFYPSTPTRDSESATGTEHLQPVSSPQTPSNISDDATVPDLVAEEDYSSEVPVTPVQLSEGFRQAKEELVLAMEDVRALTETETDLPQTLVEKEVIVPNSNSGAPTFIDGERKEQISGVKVKTAANVGKVQRTGKGKAATLDVHNKPSGEFWADVGRGLPYTIFLSLCVVMFLVFLSLRDGPVSQAE